VCLPPSKHPPWGDAPFGQAVLNHSPTLARSTPRLAPRSAHNQLLVVTAGSARPSPGRRYTHAKSIRRQRSLQGRTRASAPGQPRETTPRSASRSGQHRRPRMQAATFLPRGKPSPKSRLPRQVFWLPDHSTGRAFPHHAIQLSPASRSGRRIALPKCSG
jgi:hypothetical protein